MKKIILLFLTFIFINLNSYSLTEKYFDIEEIKKDYSPECRIIFNNEKDVLYIVHTDSFNIALAVAPALGVAYGAFEGIVDKLKKFNFIEVQSKEDRKKKFKMVEFTVKINGEKKFGLLLLKDRTIASISAMNYQAYIVAQDLLRDLEKYYTIKN